MNKLNLSLIASFLFLISNPLINNGKNEYANFKIGDFANGGIVFWLDESGQHGLVCAKSDQSEGISWYAGTYIETKAREDGILSGKKNTASIIAAQKSNTTYAARICNELEITEVGQTFDDWYLPCKAELDLMFQNKDVIDASAAANGGKAFDTNAFYWSSTESRRGFAFAQGFASGSQMIFTEDNTFRVRAVRSF